MAELGGISDPRTRRSAYAPRRESRPEGANGRSIERRAPEQKEQAPIKPLTPEQKEAKDVNDFVSDLVHRDGTAFDHWLSLQPNGLREEIKRLRTMEKEDVTTAEMRLAEADIELAALPKEYALIAANPPSGIPAKLGINALKKLQLYELYSDHPHMLDTVESISMGKYTTDEFGFNNAPQEFIHDALASERQQLMVENLNHVNQQVRLMTEDQYYLIQNKLTGLTFPATKAQTEAYNSPSHYVPYHNELGQKSRSRQPIYLNTGRTIPQAEVSAYVGRMAQDAQAFFNHIKKQRTDAQIKQSQDKRNAAMTVLADAYSTASNLLARLKRARSIQRQARDVVNAPGNTFESNLDSIDESPLSAFRNRAQRVVVTVEVDGTEAQGQTQ